MRILCIKRFLYTASTICKLVVLFYLIKYLGDHDNYELTTEELITLINIIVCIPLDLCIIYYKKMDISLNYCLSMFMALFVTPLISTLYIVNNLDINGKDFSLKLLIITCYFYNMFTYIICYCIDCFDVFEYNYDEEKK